MNDNKIFSEEFNKELIKIGILVIIFLIKNKTSNTEIDWINSIKDSLLIISTSLIYFFLINIFNIVRKPIKILVDLKNFNDNENSTCIYGYGMNREDVKTIVLHVEIIKSKSIWNKLALKWLKNRDVCVYIHSLPKNQSLVCQPLSITEDIEIVEEGFLV